MSGRGWARLLEAGRGARTQLLGALADPAAAQDQLLRRILRDNANTAFGRVHGFDSIDGIAAFQARVPMRNYDEIWPWIERVTRGETGVLSGDAVIAFEQTGGSTGGRRLIPYSQKTLAAFQQGVLAWIGDLCLAHPAIMKGHAYFAISPALRNRPQSIGDLPVGLESDAAYFGQELAADLGAILVGAQTLGGEADTDEWLLQTLTELAAARNLTLISVWSPTFLTMLLDGLETRADEVARRLAIRPVESRDRARYARALRGGALNVRELWPGLQLVSAWADASSAAYAERLRNRLNGVAFQPKGLLATEGVFTVPLIRLAHPTPALTSSFLEFIGDDSQGRLIDNLREGETYELVVTTPGGLYRYRIGDRVLHEGYDKIEGVKTPMLSFVGRASDALDLVGEKLDGAFIASCLREAGGFAVLAPDQPVVTGAEGYVLIVDCDVSARIETVQMAVEEALKRNPLYNDALNTCQLRPLRVASVPDAQAAYMRARLAAGRRLGDIKVPVSLKSWEDAVAIWPCIADGKSC